MSVIEEIYRGEIHYQDTCNPGTVEYKEASDAAFDAFNVFYASLSPEQKKLYDAHESARITVEGMEQEERFKQGVLLGAKLIRELNG